MFTRNLISAFISLGLAGFSLAQVNPSLDSAERRIAAAQAEQQREAQDRADQQRRAQLDVARRLEAEREEQRRALILRQHQAEAQAAQNTPSTGPEAFAQPSPQPAPPSPHEFAPRFSPSLLRALGIGLFASGLLLGLARLVRHRFIR